MLPDSARVWIFGSALPLTEPVEQALLRDVDAYLVQWKAHGEPLTVGRDWREHQFLTIAVDVSGPAASGCSLDGLFRTLRQLDVQYGSALLGSGRVYYRAATGEIRCVDREAFTTLSEQGEVTSDTAVFDPTVPTLGEWRLRFEATAGRSWHSTLLPASAR